jgi:hypothetical protein
MEVTGKIKMIDQTKEVGSGGFKKRDVVVTTDEQYPQHISVQFVQDKCDLLNTFQEKQNRHQFRREWTNAQGGLFQSNTWRIGNYKLKPFCWTNAPMPAAEAFAPATNLKRRRSRRFAV